MILLMGIPSETPLRLLAEACAAKGLNFDFFNQRHQDLWRVKPNNNIPGDSVINNGYNDYRLNNCKGLYLRLMEYTQVPEYAESENQTAVAEMYGQLFQLLNAETSCRIINVPSVQMSNNSKPYQALVIKKYGLDIPDTCITSNEEVARAFLAKHKSAIYKSISGARSIVKQVDEASLLHLHKIKYCPVQFQECVTGHNVRVHVVGQRTFATKILTDATDYRYAGSEGKSMSMETFELPVDIAEKCVSLAHGLHLPFAGIDLMMTDDGRTICFEVNPSPGYSYYEQLTGQPISHSLADYLEQGTC